MPCVEFAGGVVCYSDAYKLKDGNGKVWLFENHRYCGPMTLKKNGDPCARQPGARSPFWPAYAKWFKRNFKKGPDGWPVRRRA